MSFQSLVNRIAAAVLAVAGLTVLSPVHAATCSTSPASLRGWYAMLVSGGSLATNTAKYQVGAVLFDGVGRLAANNIYGSGGSPVTATGTYVQNSDCTLTLSITAGAAAATYTVAVNDAGEAAGIETDATGVANISLKPQFPTFVAAQKFNVNSLNGTYAASCGGPLSASSDLNLATFKSGSLSGTDPYNNDGSFSVSNVPYTGTYTVNTDGTFAGSLIVLGTPFDYYGVITSSNSQIEYIYANVSGGVATAAFASCTGSVAPTPSTAVNLAPYYNVNAVVSNGIAPANGGTANSGTAYSANLLGSSVTWNGLVFPIGPPNLADAVTSKTIALPAGQFSTLNLLATAVYGPHTGAFVVTYTDGTTSTFTQSLSDWSLAYQGVTTNFANEAIAAVTASRVVSSGATQAGPWYLFGYSFGINNAKTVASLTLPASTDIIVLSAVLAP